jgi:hypothetical protein
MMWKRFILPLLAGLICGAIIGAGSFALAARFSGRGMGVLYANSPAFAAVIGAVYLGTCGGVVGAVIGILNLNVARSGVFGLACGVLLVITKIWRSESKYFYEGGYFDKQMLFSDIIEWITLVLGLGLVAVAVAVLQRKRLGKGK